MNLIIILKFLQINTNPFWFSLLGGAFGAGIISLIAIILNNYYDKIKYEKEVKTFLWKEKIEASKKASEFYYEFLNYINIVIVHLELLSDKDIGYSNLTDKIVLFEEKLNKINSYDYHHVNIFYDLTNENTKDLTLKINKNFHKIGLLKEDSKNSEIKILIKDIKSSYSELEASYHRQIRIVRSNINNYIN